ncbi:MAG: hypothetical protein ACXVAM_18895 [Vulcanimicrobiaceae bacterium]
MPDQRIELHVCRELRVRAADPERFGKLIRSQQLTRTIVSTVDV